MSQYIETVQELNSFKEPIRVVKVYDDNCGPCQMYKPKFESIANDYKAFPQLKFISVPADKNVIGVKAIPATVFFIGHGPPKEVITGPDEYKVRTRLNEILTSA